MTMEHADVIDAARKSFDVLLATELNTDQQQAVVDLMNAFQDLNNLYWDKGAE